MPKKLENTVLGKQYSRARAWVKREFPVLLEGRDGAWYGPLVEAHVAGQKAQRRQVGKPAEHTK